ncbi:hypothetical protein [Ornithinimicrobium cavernae]|uniref:hypothetical protein n=1 Tax=Ornithinimicrobium cavernae TaxID=2666047 RepID=UPI000D6890B4|nr:hypothetical protein [Ornithinimicrobium cavernae]
MTAGSEGGAAVTAALVRGGTAPGGQPTRRWTGGATALVLDRPGERLGPQVWAGLLVALAAVALTAVSIPTLSALYGVFVPLSFLLAAAHGGALVLATYRAGAAIGLSALAVLTTGLLTVTSSGLPWPLPVATMITQLLVVAFVALRGGVRVALTALLASVVAASAPLVLMVGDGDLWSVAAPTLVTFHAVAVLVTGLALVASRLVPWGAQSRPEG